MKPASTLNPANQGSPPRQPQFADDAVAVTAAGLPGLAGFLDRPAAGGGAASQDPHGFFEAALGLLNIRLRTDARDLARFPVEGPFMIVCNQPFGSVEGIILGKLVTAARPDYKFLGNRPLYDLPELRDFIIPVENRSRSLAAQEAVAWLRQGGVLGAFPAGKPARLHWRLGRVTDPAWDAAIAGVAREAGVTVVPLYLEGNSSFLVQALNAVHAGLRAALLSQELLGRQDREVCVRIGNPIPGRRVAAFASDHHLAAYLRLRTFVLKSRRAKATRKPTVRFFPMMQPAPAAVEPLVEMEAPALLAAEVARLVAADQMVTQGGEFQVIMAEAPQIPHLLYEIGRLREFTFRQAGEGTGKAMDLDRYDMYYSHLFAWNREKEEVVGAYRVGRTDRILPHWGKRGLYTHTLFRYRSALVANLGPALELGRSFVRPEYQRNFSPLLLLWKGISQFVVRNPQYRYLFGPVSISDEYQPVSRHLIVAFLEANHLLPELASQVRARKPMRTRRIAGLPSGKGASGCADLEELSKLIEEIEGGGKGIPILLKQYLKLGGQMLGFNVDKAFGNVVDGLVLVDVAQADPRILDKYMGKTGAAAFLAYHGKVAGPATVP